jgi:hypothetical protein
LIERQNVVAGAVTFLLRYPAYLSRKVRSIRLLQTLPLKMENHFFALKPELAIDEISLGRIELAH